VSALPRAFWSKIRRLVVADDGPAPLPEPRGDYLRELRRRIADRGAPQTLQLYRRLARLAGQRVEEVCGAEFDRIFDSEQVACLVQETFKQLFDGGLAEFRGSCEADLLAFVRDRADRVVLRGAVAEWTDHEVGCAWRSRYRDLFSPEEAEDLAGEAVTELLRSALASFRGETPAELYAFCRTVAHRTVSRAARRRVRDRSSLALLRSQQERPGLASDLERLPRLGEDLPLPISGTDREYLEELIALDGSRSSLARHRGVNRSAVTKMVQRIMVRLDELDDEERQRVGEWASSTWSAIQAARATS
jgi:hypothetical protein